MDMEITELEGSLRNIALSGRLDTPGVGRIETRLLAAVVPTGKSAIVDLSKVDFIASMGIRLLLSVARSLKQRQAKLVLYAPQELVNDVLMSVSLTEVLPVCADAAEAIAAVRS